MSGDRSPALLGFEPREPGSARRSRQGSHDRNRIRTPKIAQTTGGCEFLEAADPGLFCQLITIPLCDSGFGGARHQAAPPAWLRRNCEAYRSRSRGALSGCSFDRICTKPNPKHEVGFFVARSLVHEPNATNPASRYERPVLSNGSATLDVRDGRTGPCGRLAGAERPQLRSPPGVDTCPRIQTW